MESTLGLVIAWSLIVFFIVSRINPLRYCLELLEPKHRHAAKKNPLTEPFHRAVRIVIHSPCYKKIHDDYCATKHHLKSKSQEFISYAIRKFCNCLEAKGIKCFSDLTIGSLLAIVASFKSSNPRSMSRLVLGIGHFFEYLNSEGLSAITFPFSLLHVQQRSERIPSYSKQEVKALLHACNRSTPSGKRGYAIILLAVTCGLRQCDIQKLTLQSIDWHTYKLLVLQEKTQSYVTLPLLSETGDAVAEYILNARPRNCESDRIFVSIDNPNQEMGHSACKHLLERLERRAHLKSLNGRGFHSLRRSTATWLAESGVPVTDIAQILGHSGMHSVDKYISANARMRRCCLGFEGIQVESEVYL